jgi:putative peptide zinc metalloprotease protein
MVLIRNRIKEVEARTSRDFGVSIKGLISRDAMGGSNKIVSSALTTYGGGLIPENPSDPDHLTTLDKTFDLEVVLQKPVEPAVFGDRAYVRFDLGSLPILWQWSLRLKQLFLARLGY